MNSARNDRVQIKLTSVFNIMKPLKSLVFGVALAAAMATPPMFSQSFGVWLDGVTTDPGTDGALNSLNHAFGAGHYTLLSNAALESSLDAYDTIIMSRSGASFGSTSISAAAAANIQSYVGAFGSPGQGGVALFTNDAKDNWYGSASGDPYDANLDRLFVNAATFAAATGHGFIGEFNGTVIGINSLGLLPGTAGGLGGASAQFHYAVGPIGTGHPIDTGVVFPFVDSDPSPFLTRVSGADPSTVVDVFTSEPQFSDGSYAPAVLANAILIEGGHPPGDGVPDTGSTLALLSIAMVVLLGRQFRATK